MKHILLFILVTSVASFSFANKKSFLDTVVGTKIEECKEHLNIRPFVAIAYNTDLSKSRAYTQVEAKQVKLTFKHYKQTGKINLPPEKLNDQVALKCAAYAEGLMAGGIGHRLIFLMRQGITDVLGEEVGEFIGQGIEKAINSKAQNKK